MSLIVTGSIGIDTIETHDGQITDSVLGGAAIYFSAAASFFGPVRLVAAVGEDFPEEHLNTFEHFTNIDLAGLEKRKGSKTFRWHGKYQEDINLRDTVGVDLNILLEAMPPVPEQFMDSQYVFLAVTEPSNQIGLLEKFPNAKLTIADTIDLYINIARDAFESMLTKVDGIVINDAEATLLTGERNLMKAGDKIIDMGVSFAVIKKGEHGAVLCHKDGDCALPAYPARKVIDPTGAGDTFAGGMMGYLSKLGDKADQSNRDSKELVTSFDALRRAIAYGTVVASYNIETYSLQRLMEIGADDIHTRAAEYGKMLKIDM